MYKFLCWIIKKYLRGDTFLSNSGLERKRSKAVFVIPFVQYSWQVKLGFAQVGSHGMHVLNSSFGALHWHSLAWTHRFKLRGSSTYCWIVEIRMGGWTILKEFLEKFEKSNRSNCFFSMLEIVFFSLGSIYCGSCRLCIYRFWVFRGLFFCAFIMSNKQLSGFFNFFVRPRSFKNYSLGFSKKNSLVYM